MMGCVPCKPHSCCRAVQVNTWRLAAEQAADLAEAANQRAASCECKLADTAQQLAEQARATLKLGEELKQARSQLDDRWADLSLRVQWLGAGSWKQLQLWTVSHMGCNFANQVVAAAQQCSAG
jgi:hypothetical protein